MNDSIEYLCEKLSFFSTKGSVSHMHCLAVYVKEGISSPRDLNFGNSEDSPYLFDWLCFIQRYRLTYHTSRINFSQSILLRMYLFFETINHHKGELTYFGKTYKPGELGIIFKPP